MKLLLDTHAFIWWDSDKSQLSHHALTECVDPQNQLFLSIVSIWEMQIKAQLGKLELRLPLRNLVDDHRRKGPLIASLEVEDVLGLAVLPMVHRDPFDRLLVSQARRGGFQLVSRDPPDRKLRRDYPLVKRVRIPLTFPAAACPRAASPSAP